MNDVERGLRLLGEERRRLGTEIRDVLQFDAAARAFAAKIADDIVHDRTGLCARCDGEAYQHAVADLTEALAGHISADLAEGVRLWLETREVAL